MAFCLLPNNSFNCYLTLPYLGRVERGSCSENCPCLGELYGCFQILVSPKTPELKGLEGVNNLVLYLWDFNTEFVFMCKTKSFYWSEPFVDIPT